MGYLEFAESRMLSRISHMLREAMQKRVRTCRFKRSGRKKWHANMQSAFGRKVTMNNGVGKKSMTVRRRFEK